MRKVISLVIVIFILGFSLSAQTPDSLGVYSVAEVMPSYVGGDAALYEYINHNVQYPKDALAQKKQGKVQLKMVIDENGTVMDAKVLRGVCSSIDSEATHVIKTTTGKWESGRINGKSVKTYKYLSVTFKIDTAEETEGSPIVFIGGDSAFLSFIRKHIEVPETMKEHPKLWDSVTVSVSFNSLNQIIAVVALKGPIKELNEEAIRLVKLSQGKWMRTNPQRTGETISIIIPVPFDKSMADTNTTTNFMSGGVLAIIRKAYNSDEVFRRAYDNFEMRNFELAISDLSDCVKSKPAIKEASIMMRAYCYLYMSNYPRACEDLQTIKLTTNGDTKVQDMYYQYCTGPNPANRLHSYRLNH